MSLRAKHWPYLVFALLAYLLVRFVVRYYFHYRGEVAIVLFIIVFFPLCFLVIQLVRRWRARP
jgi:hypothetical protein